MKALKIFIYTCISALTSYARHWFADGYAGEPAGFYTYQGVHYGYQLNIKAVINVILCSLVCLAVGILIEKWTPTKGLEFAKMCGIFVVIALVVDFIIFAILCYC